MAEGWIMPIAGNNASPVPQHESDLSLADGFAINGANAFSFANFAAEFYQLDLNHELISGAHRFAPLHILSGHKVSDLAPILRLLEHKNYSHLRDRFHLKHTRHDRVTRKMALEERFVDGDVFHSDDMMAFNPRHFV